MQPQPVTAPVAYDVASYLETLTTKTLDRELSDSDPLFWLVSLRPEYEVVKYLSVHKPRYRKKTHVFQLAIKRFVEMLYGFYFPMPLTLFKMTIDDVHGNRVSSWTLDPAEVQDQHGYIRLKQPLLL